MNATMIQRHPSVTAYTDGSSVLLAMDTMQYSWTFSLKPSEQDFEKRLPTNNINSIVCFLVIVTFVEYVSPEKIDTKQ